MRIYELEARFDARKSFYGKAHVIDHESGDREEYPLDWDACDELESIIAECMEMER